ncbi:hypothetical protein VTN00DRAFT_2562 [Thermoascus crustaceus]|uniref:uncharacterized protein n=1 Tax=Thermoascus crustaceus TaxID=5088 RepID=UPI0037442C63
MSAAVWGHKKAFGRGDPRLVLVRGSKNGRDATAQRDLYGDGILLALTLSSRTV